MKTVKIIMSVLLFTIFAGSINCFAFTQEHILLEKTAIVQNLQTQKVDVTLSITPKLKKDIILLIDASSSMGLEKLHFQVKEACKQFTQKALAHTGTRISVISFSSYTNQNGKGFRNYATSHINFSDEYSKIEQAINSIAFDGETNLSAGFAYTDYIIEKNQDPNREVDVILFTDGVPNLYIEPYNDPYQGAYSEGAKVSRKSNLYTLGYLTAINDMEREKTIQLFEKLSSENYYDIYNKDMIESVYDAIYNQIFNYFSDMQVQDQITPYFTLDKSSFVFSGCDTVALDNKTNTIYWSIDSVNSNYTLKYSLLPNYEVIDAKEKLEQYPTNQYAKVEYNLQGGGRYSRYFPEPSVPIALDETLATKGVATFNGTFKNNIDNSNKQPASTGKK